MKNDMLLGLLIACAHIAGPATARAAGSGHAHSADVIGVRGTADKVVRTVAVDMSDRMRFVPSTVTVDQGDTIRFVVKNSGRQKHEFVLGTDKELQTHYEAMKRFPEMEHADPNMVTVAPGGTGEVIWRFTRAGTVDFACLQVGHYDAGMKGAVKIAGRRGMTATPDHRDEKRQTPPTSKGFP